MIISFPKICVDHQKRQMLTDDYLVGHMNDINPILYYDGIPQTRNTTNTIYQFEWIGSDYYTHTFNTIHNTAIASILYVFSPTFSLLTSVSEINNHIQEFRKQMGLDLVEKGLFKSLHLSTYKIKRKALMESLFKLDTEMQQDHFHMFITYICVRFNIRLLIISQDGTFNEFNKNNENSNYIVILKNIINKKTIYTPLLPQNGNINLIPKTNVHIIIKQMITQLIQNIPSFTTLKVAQLTELAHKMGLLTTGLKRDDLIIMIDSYIRSIQPI